MVLLLVNLSHRLFLWLREDVVDAIKRMGPRAGLGGGVAFGGWARMAMPLLSLTIDEVGAGYMDRRTDGYMGCVLFLCMHA